MHTLAYQTLLALHVAGGATALVTGLIAMFARKGGKLHNAVGRIYYWAMFDVFVTVLGICALFPTKTFYHFFLMLSIVSFYPSFAGKRVLRLKKKGTQPEQLDRFAAWVLLVCGLGMWIYGGGMLYRAETFMAILFWFFGFISVSNGYRDIRLFAGKVELEKMHWFYSHLARMLTSYSAATTAFLVNIGPRLLPDSTPGWVEIVLWTAPPTLVGIAIARWTRYYRRKFNPTPKQVPVEAA
jgi:uncharacterized membrane protein